MESSFQYRQAAKAPLAGRAQVFSAMDQLVKDGGRPTVDAVRRQLGGGSQSSLTRYMNEWYGELGERLGTAEEPLAGVPPVAAEALRQLWQVAAKSSAVTSGAGAVDAITHQAVLAERDALLAQNRALETLHQELTRQRASAETALATTRALLTRREASAELDRAQQQQLQEQLARVLLELEVVKERTEMARRPVRAPLAQKKRRQAQPPQSQPKARRKKVRVVRPKRTASRRGRGRGRGAKKRKTP